MTSFGKSAGPKLAKTSIEVYGIYTVNVRVLRLSFAVRTYAVRVIAGYTSGDRKQIRPGGRRRRGRERLQFVTIFSYVLCIESY